MNDKIIAWHFIDILIVKQAIILKCTKNKKFKNAHNFLCNENMNKNLRDAIDNNRT